MPLSRQDIESKSGLSAVKIETRHSKLALVLVWVQVLLIAVLVQVHAPTVNHKRQDASRIMRNMNQRYEQVNNANIEHKPEIKDRIMRRER